MSSSNLQSKLSRAVRQTLILAGAGSTDDTFFEMSSAERALPNTTIIIGEGAEQVFGTGNWRFQNLTLLFRSSAAVQPEESNPNAAWQAAQDRYSRICDALRQVSDTGSFLEMAAVITAAGRGLAVTDGSPEADQVAADNEDMNEFTCFYWKDVSLGALKAHDDGIFYEAELVFDVVACNGSFD